MQIPSVPVLLHNLIMSHATDLCTKVIDILMYYVVVLGGILKINALYTSVKIPMILHVLFFSTSLHNFILLIAFFHIAIIILIAKQQIQLSLKQMFLKQMPWAKQSR